MLPSSISSRLGKWVERSSRPPPYAFLRLFPAEDVAKPVVLGMRQHMGHVHCCSLSIRYACQLQLMTLHLTRDVVMQSMRMLLSFGVRRHMVHAAPEPSYEAMLALDENNPRRGVKKHILEGLPHVWPSFQTGLDLLYLLDKPQMQPASCCNYAACMCEVSTARLARLQEILPFFTYSSDP